MRFRFWRKFRLCVRWLRRLVLVAVATLLVALAWFDWFGLPDFLKKPLINELHARGVDLEFIRMRLRLSGLVAENVRVGNAKVADSPVLALAEVQLQPDFRALLFHGRMRLEGLRLRQGRVVWRFSTNVLSVENINSDLHFGTNDTWSLDNFKADFAGARLALSGDVIHASELRDWDVFHGRKTSGTGWRRQWTQLSEALAKTRPHPQLTLTVHGDARDVNSFIVNLAVMQGHTHVQFEGRQNEMAQSFRWRVHGAVDPSIIRPFLFTSNAVRVMDHFNFHEPVFVDANVYGRVDDPDSLGANGFVTATNFAVRGEAVDQCAGDFIYTNRTFEFFKPQIAQGKQAMTAEQITIDLRRRRIGIKNGLSTADPHSVARAIGSKTGRLLEPYHFFMPPTVRVNGWAPLHDLEGGEDAEDADLTFDVVKGEDFRCLKFNAQTVTGTIHWVAQTLVLTNVVAQFYGGSGNGWAFFDFGVPHAGADFQFGATVTHANLHLIAADLNSPTNKLEGWLSGEVTVTHAETHDWQAVNGYGHARLRDGLIWDIPIFGVLSPLFNALSPGLNLGNNRATDANGKFTITNGVVHSDLLEIHTTLMRLQYSGNVDLQQNIHAYVTAQPMKDVPVIGPLINFFFSPFSKLFELKVTGTLKNPKSEPVHL